MRSITEILKYCALPIALVAVLLAGGFWAATLPSQANRQAGFYAAGLPAGAWASPIAVGMYTPAAWPYEWNWPNLWNPAATLATGGNQQPGYLLKMPNNQGPEISSPADMEARRDLTGYESAQARTIESLGKDGIGFLTAGELQEKMKSSWHGIVVDVGAKSAYKYQHILGSVNIPENQIERLAPVVLPDRQTPIVTYCGSTECNASMDAAKQFKALGYAEVYDFWGGLKEWVAMGLPARGSEVAGK